MTGYPVPAGEREVELRFKNSRFIGTAGPAATVEEARAFIEKVRQKYPDASHHVYAFAAGYGASVVHGMSDDGEPSGTAGRPCLAVVQGSGLGDVVVVITRYFGGTKLGTGGLVKAYTQTAQAVLAELPRQEKVHRIRFRAEVGYDQHALCRRIAEECGGEIEREEFGEKVELWIAIRDDEADALARRLRDATSDRIVLDQIEEA